MSSVPGADEPPQDPYRQPSGYGAQPPYGGQPPYYGAPPSYGPPPGYPGGGYPMDHPKATTSLVLGILGFVVCGVLSPFAWRMGKRAVAEIDASQGQLGGRGSAQAGYVLGLIGTILLVLAVLLLVLVVLLVVMGLATSTTTSTSF